MSNIWVHVKYRRIGDVLSKLESKVAELPPEPGDKKPFWVFAGKIYINFLYSCTRTHVKWIHKLILNLNLIIFKHNDISL